MTASGSGAAIRAAGARTSYGIQFSHVDLTGSSFNASDVAGRPLRPRQSDRWQQVGGRAGTYRLPREVPVCASSWRYCNAIRTVGFDRVPIGTLTYAGLKAVGADLAIVTAE